jgi:23S rRNA (cytidine1920-2'-O)/16S rRNA (cytidine1409-2'-O)-methyltransferase
MESTNIRNVTLAMLEGPLDFASIDVAFISLTKVLPVAYELLKDGGEIAALIKPQFEAGKEKVGKKGVVREPAIHREVIENVLSFSHELGFAIKGLTFSPVKGPEGNIEYLAWLLKDCQAESSVDEGLMDEVVREAHAALDK